MYGRYKVIALCMTRVESERNFQFIKTLSEQASKKEYRIFIYQMSSDMLWNAEPERGDAEVFNLIDYDVIDYMVIFSEIINDNNLINRLINTAASHGKTVLSIGKRMKNSINFLFDYTDGIDKMTRHVIEKHGCRDICFMAGPVNEPISDARIMTFQHVMAEYGLPCDPGKQLYYGDYWTDPAKRATRQLLENYHLPDAIVCANDMMAIAVCEELRKSGYRVPEDIIVTGFDGINEALANIPSISTSGCSMTEMAERILNVLNELDELKGSDEFKGSDEHDESGKSETEAGNRSDNVNVKSGEDKKSGDKSGASDELYRDHMCGYDLIPGQSCGCVKSAEAREGIVLRLFREEQDKTSQYYDGEFDFHNFYKETIKVPHLSEFPDIMKKIRFCDLAIMLNDESFYEKEDPMEAPGRIGFYDKVNVVYKSDDPDTSAYPLEINTKDVVNGFDEIIEKGVPVVFSSLSFNDKPVGYLVFYDDVQPVKYNQIRQAVMRLDEYIGCYWLIKNLQYKNYQIDHIARHDHLTDLYNRGGFYSALKKLCEHCTTGFMAVAEIDMDGLKRINDTMGHEMGDRAIMALAGVLNQISLPRKICGRFGGDEFVVTAPVERAADGEKIKSEIYSGLEKYNASRKIPVQVNASVGISIMPAPGFDFEYAVKEADNKMYSEKTTHRGTR